jgi:phage terminase large subunit-like protein
MTTSQSSENSKRDYVAIGNQYARDVVAGKIPVCKQVIQACRRHLTDLRRQALDFEFRFDPDSATRACEFLEVLPHVKDDLERRASKGETLRLEPWQCFFLISVFGWVLKSEPDIYRFTEFHLFVPRKNGKSFLDAGIAHYKFGPDADAGAEVYFLATSEDQATDVGFKPAKMIAQKTPGLCKTFGIDIPGHDWEKAKLLTRPGGAVMKPLIAKPGDGASPSYAAIEEYHEHPSDAGYVTMKTGMGARRNPLIGVITTAGFDLSSPCYSMQQDDEKVLAGTVQNERLFILIYTLDPEDDWQDPAVLPKANPNYGVSVNPAKLINEQQEAIASPRKRAWFKTKYLNMWVNGAVAWIPAEEWKACTDPDLKIEDFEEAECSAALDLADVKDLCDKVLVFPKSIDGKKHFFVFATHYLNEQAVSEAAGDHFEKWAAEGWLKVTAGNVTDYPQLADELVADVGRFTVREIPFDPYHSRPLVQFIEAREDWNQSAEFVDVPQTPAMMGPAMQIFETAVLERRLHHNGDPLLAWMVSNVVCRRDRRGGLMPDKAKPENKIDGATAMLMGILRANAMDVGSGAAPNITVLG